MKYNLKIKKINPRDIILNYLFINYISDGFWKTFHGLYIFGFRLGELIIGLGMLASLMCYFFL